jgi:flagellar basal-body rod modification protein FlgD
MIGQVNSLSDSINQLGYNKSDNTEEKKELGQTDFMALLVAQLEHQNPLEPQENGEFISQMAQFGTLDGINALNDTFSAFTESMNTSQTLQATSLVGHEVFVSNQDKFLQEGQGISGIVELSSSTPDARINIKDQTGALIRQIDIGAQSSGEVSFTWDGLNQNGQRVASQMVRIEAMALIDGKTEALPTQLGYNVDSVSMNPKNGLLLNLDGRHTASLSEVKSIK